MIADLTVLQGFHVLLLEYLFSRFPEGLVLKGGVNLRLFFGSVRYSQDMDFDAEPRLRLAIREAIRRALADPNLKRQLVGIGVGDVPIPRRPAKDTETTLRYKLLVVTAGGIALPTKVEVSFRERAPMDVGVLEDANTSATQVYRREGASLRVRHYPRLPAIRQKVAALALRNAVQARDVFDLALLVGTGLEEPDAAALRKEIPDGVLEKALARTLAISYPEYSDKVLPYLDESDRRKFEGEGAWDEQCLLVRYFIEGLQALPGPASVLWHSDVRSAHGADQRTGNAAAANGGSQGTGGAP